MTKDEDFESPKIQTWVLKVSIHDCEKCYKKVERVLHSIDGVHDFTVDAGKQKVTVTGNVHSKILLKELRKSFKNADLWPVAQNKEPETPKQQEGRKSGKYGGGDANEHAMVAQNKKTETPSYCCEQTWTLKVHSNCYCEGCKQKISKVLQSIDGVRSITIDVAEQKVTVTGNVASADVLLKKLLKSGKPAELWEVAQNKQQNEAKTQEHQKEQKLGKDGGSYANEDAAVAESKMQNQNPKSTKQQKEQNLGRHEDNGQQLEEDALFNDQPKMFEMKTLSLSTKLGEGGFGTVYKGTTHDGKQVAVKKLSLNSDQRTKEFLNEVKLLAKVKHRNLVKLLGCCVDGSERWIVYEYLPNKSLHEFLSDADKRKELDWQKRHGIIRGSASGLLYLHQGSQPRIVHRDIKPSNILLDDKLNPKIGDFGIAKLFPEDVTRLNTVPAGSFGYMAPECIMSGELSVKADVYSFGVVLLELTTGRKMGDRTPSSEMVLRWVWRKYREGNTEEIIDPVIIEACDVGKASRCIHVGLLCTQMDSSLRPSMSEVNSMLSTDYITLAEPTKPPF